MTQKVVDILEGESTRLGLKGVYFGDQELIPEYPAVTVEPGTKTRTIRALHEYELNLTTTIYLYHGKVQSSETTMKENTALAEELEDVLAEHRKMDGVIINSIVTRMDPGIVRRNDVMRRVTRITLEALSKELF